jgi:transcriptional antiterminator NusG
MEFFEEMGATDEVDDELSTPDGKDADDIVQDSADETSAEEADSEKAPAPAAEPAPSESSRLKWYVVHTYSGHEQKAKRHLESAVITAGMDDKFGEIVVPTEQVTEMKEGNKNTSMRKFLPSYLLVEMDMDLDSRHLVTSCPGITNFVGASGKPQPLDEEEVGRIIGQMEKGPVMKSDDMPYSSGDAVKVTDGPFADFSGVVSEVIPERKKLKVMVSIFGRPTPVELDYLQVQPA